MWAGDMAAGMYFLHSRKNPIVHRDLKSPNILLKTSTQFNRTVAKIADFGLSHALTFTEAVLQRKDEACDNRLWHAPEVIVHRTFDMRTDVYAYGVIMWELLARRRPFEEIPWMTDVEDSIKAGGRPPVDPAWPAPYVELMTRCWAQNPFDRPSFKAILPSIVSFQTLAQVSPSHAV
jgi:serine/threonine protein kinase